MMSATRPSVRRSHPMCFTSPAGDVASATVALQDLVSEVGCVRCVH